ncbi:MAG: hypothetical protein HKP26_03760 [Nitrosopumilus sp.]|nr:hypothetical protein [Nitrosopumilus sp.]
MNLKNKFSKELNCICNFRVIFEFIDDIECDWGFHSVIQCPNCQELFSIDCECPAFQNILKLIKNNPNLYTNLEQSNYVKNSHPS